MSSILVFAIGAAVGSFLNVVADRLPEGQSVVRPRSHCSSCRRPLSNAELVPVLSYLWLRGRCRHCGARIPARLALVEAGTGLLFVVILLKVGLTPEFTVMATAASLLVVVAIIDLERGLILNRIILPSLVILLVLSPFWSHLGTARVFLGTSGMIASFANSVTAGLGAFLAFFGIALAFPKGMGGGDVKMAGLLGLLVGFPAVFVAIYSAVLVGGTVAISLLLLRKKGRKDAIPFGPFLSLGGIIALLAGDDVISGYHQIIERIAGA